MLILAGVTSVRHELRGLHCSSKILVEAQSRSRMLAVLTFVQHALSSPGLVIIFSVLSGLCAQISDTA